MMVRSLSVLIAVVATASASLVMAAPATADEADYLRILQPKYVYVSGEQLLAEGYKVCSAIAGGSDSSEVVDIVRNDLKVSVATAFDIVSNAITRLDC